MPIQKSRSFVSKYARGKRRVCASISLMRNSWRSIKAVVGSVAYLVATRAVRVLLAVVKLLIQLVSVTHIDRTWLGRFLLETVAFLLMRCKRFLSLPIRSCSHERRVNSIG